MGIAYRASNKTMLTTVTDKYELWQDSVIVQVASAKWHIVQIYHTCHAQTVSHSTWEHLVSTPKSSSMVENIPLTNHMCYIG